MGLGSRVSEGKDMNPAIYIVIAGIVICWSGQLSAFRAGYEHRKAGTKVIGEVARKFDVRGLLLAHLGIAVIIFGCWYGMGG